MKRKPYRYLFYLGLRGMQLLVLWLPRRISFFLASGIGRLAFLAARRERKKTLLHLTWAYGTEKTPNEIRQWGKRVFIHFAQSAVDVLRFPQWNQAKLDQLIEGTEQLEIFDRVLSEGKGLILLTAHLGNWELLGPLLTLRGYRGGLIGRRIYYERFNQFLVQLRAQVLIETFYQDASPKEFLKLLSRNEILAILADQDVDRLDGIFVPFFGRPAYTLTAPVKLALASKAPLVPTFLVRSGSRYRLLVEEPIRVEGQGTREEIVREYTARWSQQIEEKIRAYPDQWVWMHRRWKTTPRSEAAPVEVG